MDCNRPNDLELHIAICDDPTCACFSVSGNFTGDAAPGKVARVLMHYLAHLAGQAHDCGSMPPTTGELPN